MELDRTEQWGWPGKSFPIFKVFSNCIQLIRASKIQKGNLQGFTNFQTLPCCKQIQKEQLSFWEGFQIPNRIQIKNSGNNLHFNLV
jgi:hypothetical protein